MSFAYNTQLKLLPVLIGENLCLNKVKEVNV